MTVVVIERSEMTRTRLPVDIATMERQAMTGMGLAPI
jgi:hypothetical protein